MKNVMNTLVRGGRAVKRSVRRNSRTLAAAGAAVVATASANAQNTGVAEIVDAIEGLAPDMGTVVSAAIVIALIGIGAVAALSLGKKLMGR